ncbi:alanine racemase [Lachnospiraceae bacterium 62-35]
MKAYDRGWALIDLDNAMDNMKAMADNLADGAGMIGTVKADGYGHGAVEIARAIDPFVKGFAVASVDEALILRRHGIDKSILVLGMTGEERFEEAIRQDIRLTLFQYEKGERLSKKALSMGKKGKIHLAVDTGMSRIGMMTGEEDLEEAVKLSRLPGLDLEGIFTHFARADERDKAFMNQQFQQFISFIRRLESRGVEIPIHHCSNSAGIIDTREVNMDLVRAGISIYGLYPSNEVSKDRIRLKPVLSWKSFVSYVKNLPAGMPVSYGGTYVTNKETRVATVPIGYGDGYPRRLSGKGRVLIHGQTAPILGRICMDQFMIDVSNIDDVREGDEVTLIGRSKDEEITVEELAEVSGGFHYEILCGIGKRVPRVYIRDGKAVAVKDYFSE